MSSGRNEALICPIRCHTAHRRLQSQARVRLRSTTWTGDSRNGQVDSATDAQYVCRLAARLAAEPLPPLDLAAQAAAVVGDFGVTWQVCPAMVVLQSKL